MGRRMATKSGFNVLIARALRWSEMEGLLQAFARNSGQEVLALAALGGASEIDVGVFEDPPDRQLALPASLMRDLAELSVDLRISWYL